MADAKYFATTKKGEIFELREDLNSMKEDKKKEAVKKVIAAMTIGKDVSALFTEVLNCIQTNNLELKKLVYLYIMNYAKTQPDRAILAVNTFQNDANDPNPLIRALAIRTMGCIRVDKIVEYVCDPLRRALNDQDPYVLKTAAICVAKLYDVNPEMVEEQGFLDQLRDLISNSNPMVVANAVAALTEIDEVSAKPIFTLNKTTLPKLLAALEECTEWGQVFILTSLAKYTPKDSREAENICNRVSPRLQHANSAVVLAAVKVLMQYMNSIEAKDVVQALCQKLGPPLVTLLSKQPEVQYVALRNINLILQKRPSVLQNEIRVFFCKYNDPIYVKMEKLEIMIMLANDRNIDQVLLEFKEYAQEVDVEFVRKAVRAIGRCAIKLENAAEKCVHVLIEIIKTKISYVVQESVVVIKDIFRRYPNQYESIISLLCDNLEALDEPDAKASMIWIIGEYAEAIDRADELLEPFLDTFKDEPPQVQLQLLTAVVKLFLKLFSKHPETTQQMVQDVLNMATQETDNPDLRDRAYIYWRLLSTDAVAAKQVVLATKPLINDQSDQLDAPLLDDLVAQISTLASVYHKPPETFVPKIKAVASSKKSTKLKERETRASSSAAQSAPPTTQGSLIDDLPAAGSSGSLRDVLNSAPTAARRIVERFPVLDAQRGQGMEVRAGFLRAPNGAISLELSITNHLPQPLSQFKLQFKQNYFKLAPANADVPIASLASGQTAEASVPLAFTNQQAAVALTIDVALKNNLTVVYMTVPFPLYNVFAEGAPTQKDAYLQAWKSIEKESYKDIANLFSSDLTAIQSRLEAYNVLFVAKRKGTDEYSDVYYMSCKLLDGATLLLELAFAGANCKLCTKSSVEGYVPFVEKTVERILTLRA
jgi:AP-1 complex subunit beta-1